MTAHEHGSSHGIGQRIRFTQQDGVARLRLIRPDAANAIDLTFAQELRVAVDACAADGARAVLISAEGKQFCGGGDLRSFAQQDDLSAHLGEVLAELHPALALLAELDAPIVIAVEGSVAGAGVGLVCAGDIVLASASSRFVMAYTAAGLTPDGSSSYFLPRLVGPRRALEMTLTNRPIGAAEALDWGLVTRVLPDGEVAAEAERLAVGFATGPTLAFGSSKRLLRDANSDLAAHLDRERDAMLRSGSTADGQEGVAAFAARRPPAFSGD